MTGGSRVFTPGDADDLDRIIVAIGASLPLAPRGHAMNSIPVVRNASVLDGTCTAPFRADVLVGRPPVLRSHGIP